MTIEDILTGEGTEALSSEDRLRLSQWNGQCPPSIERCIHHLIQKQAEARPSAPAVCGWDGQFTYRELEEKSTLLACKLAARGVTPETFVPICLVKSCWTPVAILAVVKAGAAFVLLDPSHPRERLQLIIQDLGPTVLLTDTSSAQTVDGLARQILLVQNSSDDAESSSPPHRSSEITPSNPLYVVFTSGSTGTPKGVVVSHAAYATSAEGLIPPLMLNPASRVFQFASYAFDVSVSDHLLTLLAGGCICIPSETERQNNLGATINALRANWTFLTPSIARLLEPTELPSLETLVLGGEAVLSGDFTRWLTASLSVRVVRGLYGPAEVAAGTTVNPELGAGGTSSTNIGRAPAANCWVIDPENYHVLVPIGTAGELLVESPALSLGYLNRPDLTAAAFISSPRWLRRRRLGNAAGESRMYRTGDLVRYTCDGSLEYLGRVDTQVKIRGQRLELIEVESHVRAYLSVDGDSCAVLAEVVNCQNLPPQLGVFLHWPSSSSLSSSEPASLKPEFCAPSAEMRSKIEGLLQALPSKLPSYMVPEFCLCLNAVPLTATGKVNRRALRERIARLSPDEWKSLRTYSRSNSVEAPRTEKESSIRRLWARILRVAPESIGREDDWFQVGGNSLSAMQLVSTALKEGIVFTVKDIFQYRTLSTLADVVTESRLGDTANHGHFLPFHWLGAEDEKRNDLTGRILAAYPDGREIVEDIFPADDMFAACTDIEATSSYNLTSRIDAMLGPEVNVDQLANAWTAVLQANPILRSQFVVVDRKGYQVVVKHGSSLRLQPDCPPPGEIEDLWGLKKPLVRLMVAPMTQAHSLTLLIHHTLYDDHGLLALFQQLEQAYNSEVLLPNQHGLYLQWLAGVNHETEEYWRRLFADYQPLPLPVPLPKPDHSLLARKWLPAFSIPRRTNDHSRSGYTIDNKASLTMALVLALWGKENRSTDIVFAATHSRRGAPVPGMADMVCAAVMPLPTRIRLEPSRSIIESLGTVQAQALDALPFQNLGWYQLGELSSETAAACQCWTIFNVQAYLPDLMPPMFREWRCSLPPNYDSPQALYVNCEVHRDSVKVIFGYDPDVITDLVSQQLKGAFTTVFGLVDREEKMLVREILELGLT
ncbi:Nonribosomal peptide synthetase dtxS1 [Penicillium rolfsii]|nr:Nonribosomal peptide synthetase dtxS1 [Penicillium rolfsii]